jgi:hypothetical protein
LSASQATFSQVHLRLLVFFFIFVFVLGLVHHFRQNEKLASNLPCTKIKEERYADIQIMHTYPSLVTQILPTIICTQINHLVFYVLFKLWGTEPVRFHNRTETFSFEMRLY